MKEERLKSPPVIDDSDKSRTAESLSKMMNAETMEAQFKWQEEFNKRVIERARTLLSPEQLQEFSEFQTQMSNMQRMGIKMAREMFGGNKDASAVAPQVPDSPPPVPK